MLKKQELSRRKKLVSAAKSVVSGQVGITIGALAVSNKLSYLGVEWESRFPIFDKYRSALPLEMPVGTERLKWELEKVLELDPILAKLELKYRSKILQSCVNIIKQYEE